VLIGPRTTSIRSTLSSRKCAKLGAPLTWLGSPTRTPSINTRVWFALAPRRNTLVTLPGPPDWITAVDGTERSASLSVRYCLRSISSAVMTVTEALTSWAGTAVRSAVTTVSGKVVGVVCCAIAAGVQNAAAIAPADATARRGRDGGTESAIMGRISAGKKTRTGASSCG
jgi:hypothetical protein